MGSASHKSGFFLCPIFDFWGCNLEGFTVKQQFILNMFTNKTLLLNNVFFILQMYACMKSSLSK